jgi:tetratricopeptide (TPR) repeat protein
MPNVRHNLGVAEWLMGNSDSALAWFHQELSIYPGSYGSLLNIARIHLDGRNLEAAATYARSAITSKPYLPAGYTVWANARLLQQRIVEAESILTLGMRECDRHEFVYGAFLMASIHHDLGKTSEAERGYGNVLILLRDLRSVAQPLYEPEFSFSIEQKVGEQLDKVEARANYGLGLVHISRGALDSAIAFFRSATLLDPSHGNAHADLGVALLHLHQSDKAAEALGRAVGIDSLHFVYWFNYGNALAMLGRLPEAESAFATCVRLNHGFEPARTKLALVRRMRNEASSETQGRPGP